MTIGLQSPLLAEQAKDGCVFSTFGQGFLEAELIL
jgi:hypothetical protein